MEKAVQSYARKRAEERVKRRRRTMLSAVVPVSVEIRSYDPLLRNERNALASLLVGIGLCGGAILLHGGILLLFFGISGLMSGPGHTAENNKLNIEIVEPPPMVEEEPVEEKPVEEKKVEEKKVEEKKVEEKKVEEKKVKKKIKKKVKKVPPPDPIDTPKDPPKDPPKEPKRRTVGLNLDSTVEDGNGPSFGAGNTRMGETDEKAADPTSVEKLSPNAKGTPGAKSGENKVARRLPGKSTYTKAKLSGGKRMPSYPKSLKRRNIEGDVKLMVSIGLSGGVTSVKVLKSSGYPEMDSAAVRAAKLQKWVPAKKDGVPINTTQTYSVRFRLKDF
jgi:TonB family protein